MACATGKGRTLIDRELHLPKSWTSDRERCREAAVPDEVEFATKAVLGEDMLGRALDAGVPASFVAADEAYGQDYSSAAGASSAGSATSSPSLAARRSRCLSAAPRAPSATSAGHAAPMTSSHAPRSRRGSDAPPAPG